MPRPARAIRSGRPTAAEAFAFADALVLYDQAVALWDRVPDAERIAGTDRVALLERAAEAALPAGSSTRAVALLRAALDHLDVESGRARAALLNDRLARVLWRRGESEASLAASRAAVALMPPEASAERARILAGQARAVLLAGRYQEATGLAEAAIEVARAGLRLAAPVSRRPDRRASSGSPGARPRCWPSWPPAGPTARSPRSCS